MAQSLEEAAKTGDINGLYDSINEDPNVLDRIDAIPFVHTPLHIAVSAGHADFAIEILRLLPSLGRKLNPKGESSLHLALINKKFDTVKRLIKFDKEIIRVKGREGITPLHFIAEKDINGDQQRTDDPIHAEQQQREEDSRLDILAEFLFACPDSIEDLTIRDETALHIAVKSKNTKAVEVILGCICRIVRKRVLDYKDKEGSTALHMAVSTSQGVIVSSLRRAKASSSWPMQLAHSLCSARALESSSPDPNLAEFLNSPERPVEVLHKHIIHVGRSVSMELRSIALVVAVLIATATFQAVLSPPGGVGGPGSDSCLLTNGTSINATISSTNHLFAANTSVINATFFIPTTDDLVIRLIDYGDLFVRFYGFNTMAFVLSMLMIMFALPFQPFFLLHFALFTLMLSYGLSLFVVSPSNGSAEFFLIVSLVCAWLIFQSRAVIYQILLRDTARSKRLQMLQRLLNNVEQ